MLTSELTISVIQGGGTEEPHGEAFLTKFLEIIPGGNGDLKDGLRLTSRKGKTRPLQGEVKAHVTTLVLQRNRVKRRVREKAE